MQRRVELESAEVEIGACAGVGRRFVSLVLLLAGKRELVQLC